MPRRLWLQNEGLCCLHPFSDEDIKRIRNICTIMLPSEHQRYHFVVIIQEPEKYEHKAVEKFKFTQKNASNMKFSQMMSYSIDIEAAKHKPQKKFKVTENPIIHLQENKEVSLT